MTRARLRLHHRILIPLALVALVATGLTAYVTLQVTERALEARVEAQILSAASLVTQSDFALNPVILQSVKELAAADVVTYTSAGTVLTSTLDASASARIVSSIRAAEQDGASRSAGSAEPVLLRVDCGGRCYVAYRRVPARLDTIVAVVTNPTELAAATNTLTRTILVTALLSLVVMVLVSQFIARRVTAPLDALVRFTHDVADGHVTARAVTGDDEVGRLGQSFNDMLERLERSQSALLRSEKLALAGLLAARVAHDIRNPLSSIKMQTQLLRQRLRPTGDRQSDASLEAVQRDVVQVESVVRDLLELARPGELRREPAQIDQVIEEVLQQVAPHLAYRRIQITRDLDPVPAVPLDAERFKQALLNVINNASDAMTAGGTLTVSARAASDSSTITVDVCDDGHGVDPAVLDKVFDPFVSTKRDGVGLGLVNAKAVVDNHGGTIALAPRSPRGTRVTITLPQRTPRDG